MKKLQILLIASILFSGIIISSCDKDDENDSPTETKTDLLTSKWKIAAATIEPAFNGSTNLLTQSSSCSKDNTVLFKTDNTLTLNEEAIICSGQSQTDEGTWSFNSDKTEMSVTQRGNYEEFHILELTTTRFRYWENLTVDGVTYKATMTMTH